MKKYLAMLSLIAGSAHAACDWSNPGSNPFTGGSVVHAILDMEEIPWKTRLGLLVKYRAGNIRDVVTITKTSITGSRHKTDQYFPELFGMNFGKRQKCGDLEPASRANWKDSDWQTGESYEYNGFVIVIPDICTNVSWTYLVPAGHNEVPEPSTLLLSAAALLVALKFRKNHA